MSTITKLSIIVMSSLFIMEPSYARDRAGSRSHIENSPYNIEELAEAIAIKSDQVNEVLQRKVFQLNKAKLLKLDNQLSHIMMTLRRRNDRRSISIIGDNDTGRNYSDGSFEKSCYDYKNSSSYKGDIGTGIYNIQPKVNSKTYKVYCDMKKDDGGWTLLVTAVEDNGKTTGNWNTTNIKKRNISSPSLANYYSILGLADSIKHISEDDKVLYRISTPEKTRGGIWKAASFLSFTSTQRSKNVSLVKKFGTWNSREWEGELQMRMPYICPAGSEAVLTTAYACNGDTWGTIVDSLKYYSAFSKSQAYSDKKVTKIWYWVK